MMRKAMLILLALVFLTGCENLKEENFQLVVSPDGNVYRLNKRNGSISVIQNGEIREIKTGRIKLEIGKFYEAEDGKIIRYLGKQPQEIWKKKPDGTWAPHKEVTYVLKASSIEDFWKKSPKEMTDEELLEILEKPSPRKE